MAPVVTLTMNPAVDKMADVEQVVADRKLRCGPPRRDPGGGGLNVARVVRRLGGDVHALFPAGGPTGRMLEQLVEREEIPYRAIPAREWTRENLVIQETSTGRQFRFGMPGPELEREEWRGCLEALEELEEPPSYVVASGSLPPGPPDDFYAQVARWARRIGARLVLDSSGAALQRGVEEGVFLVKPNLRELAELVSQKSLDYEAVCQAARELVSAGRAEIVLVSMGGSGAVVAWQGGSQRIPAPTVKVVSKVGAGDSAVGAAVCALARGASPPEAARWAVAAGAAATLTAGTELAHREDVERLYASMKS
jgi:6-phosphofructokinase 2